MPSNPFVEFIRRYRPNPIRMVQEVFGIEPDLWQKRALAAYARRERRISIRSGHGVGKSAFLAWISLHQLFCHFPQKTAVTAPSKQQAFDAYFAEVKKWLKRMPPTLQALVDPKSDRIELIANRAESFLSVRTARAEKPEALQGIHSESVLLIADEGSGVEEAIFEAAIGSMSGKNAVTVLCGNPVRTSGLFFDSHHKLTSRWFTMHVSTLDSPRVDPDFVQDVIDRYGLDSNAYRVRVLGEFPITDDDTVIPFHLIESARTRYIERRPGAPIVWGVDVARFGSDKSALCKRQATMVPEKCKEWRGIDLMMLVGNVKSEWDNTPPSDRPNAIYVDAIGLGAGVADRLRELALPAVAVNVSESPAIKGQYLNLRAELWFQAREWLDARTAKLPDDDHTLCMELGMPRYKYTSNGKIQIEAKEEMKKRKIASPNAAEAFILTFAGGGAILAYGAGAGTSWSEPIKRNIRGV